jgi:4'-phosphopantetheinyl transferase
MSVEVWLVDTTASDAELAAYERVLDGGERARAVGAGTEVARRRYVVAHGAMRMLLGARLGVDPAALAFIAGPHGKPALDGLGAEVNLSHSGGWAMLALSPDRPVGVDVQRVMPSLDAAAMGRRWFAPGEAAEVAAAGPAGAAARAGVFGRLWARKEAVVKAAGGRILRCSAIEVGRSVVDCPDGPAPGLYRVRDVPAPDGYHAAVAVAGAADVDVTLRPWRPVSPGPRR